MMKHKLLIPIFVLIFSELSGSLGAEFQGFLNFQDSKNSLCSTPVFDDGSTEKIDENISRFKAELICLEGQWKRCDKLWEALDRLKEEENGDFFKSLDVGMLCKQHEKVLWGMIGLKEKICELESRKSLLIN